MSAIKTAIPGLRRLTAPNAGPMTFEGTNSYLLGRRSVAIIDPGPDLPRHREALLAAVGQGEVSHILVTHGHIDHSGGAHALSARIGVPVSAFGPATAGRSPEMEALAARAELSGGEGVDQDFVPDVHLADGAIVETGEWRLEALHTPGHLSSHLCFVLPEHGAVLTGDTVMGWSTTLISPPDGSVGAFLASLELLTARQEDHYLPGHGPEVPAGRALAAEQRAHRLAREAQIVEALNAGPRTVAEITSRIYTDLPCHLHGAAQRNVLAHLIDLTQSGRVLLPETDLTKAPFRLLG